MSKELKSNDPLTAAIDYAVRRYGSVEAGMRGAPSVHDPARPLYVRKFAEWEFGSPQHVAIKEWLAANGIPVNEVPADTRFVITDGAHPKIQIALYQVCDGKKLVSLYGNGYCKYERSFDLVASLEQFGVESLPVGEAFNLVDGPALTEARVREIVAEEFATLAAAIDAQRATI